MKNRLLAIFIALFAATFFAFGAVACDSSGSTTDSEPNESISASVTESTSGLESGNEGESSFESSSESSSSGEIEHTHDFSVENVDAKYLKSPATCTQKAIYYYSCACGEKGTSTFEYGEFAEHSFTQEVAEEKYLKSAATCKQKAVYYCSCVCGEKGSTMFEYGDFADHMFTQKVTEEKYLASAATCTQKAKYYYSCTCGKMGAETFEYGELAEHIYAEEWTYNETHHWQNSACEHNIIRNYAQHTLDVSGCCSECGYIPSTEDIVYKVSDDLTYAVVTEYNGSSKTVRVADTYLGLPVTEIWEGAFRSKSIVSVIIPDSVTLIGDSAFRYCSSLTNVTIPNSVTSIGNSAFEDCISLTSITVAKDNVKYKSIDGNLYSKDEKTLMQYAIGKKDSSFIILDSVTFIGLGAFEDCSSLTSITIGNSVTSIGKKAFSSCIKIVEVINKSSLNITKGVEDNGGVGYYALYVHNGKSKIDNKNGYQFITYNNINYLLGYIGTETEIVLPQSYNGQNYEIYKYAIYENNKITSVTIPNVVTSIGSIAFCSCSSLMSVTISDSVTSIDYGVFKYCSSLNEVFYEGTAEKWEKIIIDSGNSDLTSATIYYYSVTQPTTSGKLALR